MKANIPHFVQMHFGDINQNEIERWTEVNQLVEKQQTVEMVNIDGAAIIIGNQTETNSVMDISFVKQNESFDFLLDLHNEKLEVSSGEIGVPIYYMQKKIWRLAIR